MMLNDVKTIIDNLEDFIELPGGIECLRKAVLMLAVSGKLVPQNTAEGTAEELYVEKCKQNKKTPSAPVSREDFPFEIPRSWKWVRLSDTLLDISGGGTPSKQNATYWEGVIPWASTKDLTGKKYLHDTEDHISELGLESKPGILKPSGSIVVCTRMGLGKIAILRREMAINQDLKALLLNGMVIPEYFYLRWVISTNGHQFHFLNMSLKRDRSRSTSVSFR